MSFGSAMLSLFSSVFLFLSEGYFATTLSRHRRAVPRVCLLPWRGIRKGYNPPTPERRDVIAPSARENLTVVVVVVVVGPPLRPFSPSLAPAFRNARGRGCEGAISERTRDRVVEKWTEPDRTTPRSRTTHANPTRHPRVSLCPPPTRLARLTGTHGGGFVGCARRTERHG